MESRHGCRFSSGVLAFLSVAVPSTFIAIPLYIRHKVYSEARSAVVSSDFRVIDDHMSTTWCQGVRLEMNTTFNAYLLRHAPRFENTIRTYRTTKQFRSKISVSSCARYDAAKVIIVKGKRVMNSCIQPGYQNSDEADSAQSSDEDDEFSSWSSSEEATDELKCMRTLLNRTLTQSISCTKDTWLPKDIITFTTSETDYYYIVFSSMNPLVKQNAIFANLQLHKVVYDVKNFITKCFNVTRCSFPFSFASDEHIVLEVPDRSLWIADIVLSKCEPRTVLYFPFYVAIPISILIFAFRGNKKM
uniref:E3 ubiquitin-protein ligase APD1-4 middle domain-containing protein n=1 Tax=Strigamia maritima TaxID=126957 RepID=T1JDH9_STRMM